MVFIDTELPAPFPRDLPSPKGELMETGTTGHVTTST